MWRKKSLALVLAGFFLLLDQLLKWAAVNVWQKNILLNKFFGWRPYLNSDAAFGLPVPSWIIVALSVIVIALFIFLLCHAEAMPKQDEGGICHNYNNLQIFFSLTFATAGALSNLIDRVLWGHTIDYILIFTGIINLADVLIFVGIAGFWYFSRKN